MLVINSGKCTMCRKCADACPFNAIYEKENRFEITSACKNCGVCVKKCGFDAILETDGVRKAEDPDQWRGIMVFVEHMESITDIHPVTIELIGKAKKLAAKIGQPVFCFYPGHEIYKKAFELTEFGVDKVFVYDHENFKYYREDIYANAFEDCIRKTKPSIVLVGATSIGRSLAPAVATRFRTGLTADCTVLDVRENGELIQIRPAFGGNIMAQIVTRYTRPQFATVRYKVMENAVKVSPVVKERVIIQSITDIKMRSGIEIIRSEVVQAQPSISDARVIIAGGRGLKDKKDLEMLEELAVLINGRVAVTRPLVEAGWAPYTKQIGLSGRTVRPELIITCGISGAVQFTACMNTSACIIAINKDRNAPIFKTAHYCIVGDLYEIVPGLINKIKSNREKQEVLVSDGRI